MASFSTPWNKRQMLGLCVLIINCINKILVKFRFVLDKHTLNRLGQDLKLLVILDRESIRLDYITASQATKMSIAVYVK